MNGSQKAKINTIIGLVNQLTTIICGFILPSAILKMYGSEVNGLVNSVTQFLGFISLCELGVGAVVQSSLYKPLAERRNDQISAVMKSSQSFFSKVAIILMVYVCGLLFFLPATTSDRFDFWYTASLIIVISISLFAQYYFGISNQLLLYADQKVYIPMTLNIVTVIVNSVVSLILINSGASIQFVKLTTSIIYFLRPFLMRCYVKKHYEIDKKVKIDEEPIQQKWDGLAQHLSTVVVDRASVVVLTFSSLTDVSIYSMYGLVVNGLYLLISSLSMGVQSLMGNLIAKNERERLENCFDNFEWMMHTLITLIYSIASVMIVPFIMVYTKGVKDANYYRPEFAFIFVMSYFILGVQVIYKTVIKSAGHFRETRGAVVWATVINVVSTIVFVDIWGLVGAATGIFISMMFLTVYYIKYLSNNILYRPIWCFVKLFIIDTLVIILVNMCSKYIIDFEINNYLMWIVEAAKCSVIAIVTSLFVNCIFCFEKMKKIKL